MLKRMNKMSAIFILTLAPCIVSAQSAILEVPGVFGECKPEYASASDKLILYKSPNLEAQEIQVTYKSAWKIPYEKRSGLTRVLTFGEIHTKVKETLNQCEAVPVGTHVEMQPGDTAIFLYYLGEGFTKVRAKGAECYMFVDDDEISTRPNIQPWIRVLYADGTSPGWLLNDGSQTKNIGISC